MYLAEPRPRVYRSDPDYRRVYNLLQIDHQGLPSTPGATLSWAYGEFSDYDHHRPTDWPTAADDDLVSDVAAMTPRAYLEELHTLLSRLVTSSTDLAATLQYVRTRSHVRTALKQLTEHENAQKTAPQSAQPSAPPGATRPRPL